MRIKSTFRFLCFVMIFFSLACWIVSAHAASESSPCTSYLSAYLSAVEALESARETRDAVRVAVIKATPYASVPTELQDLEDEYDSDPDGFYKTLEGMGVGLPGYVSGPISEMQRLEIRKALSDAEAAYNAASTAYDSAKKSLEDCTGVNIVTIWCERGANCQNPPGVQGRPKAHYISAVSSSIASNTLKPQKKWQSLTPYADVSVPTLRNSAARLHSSLMCSSGTSRLKPHTHNSTPGAPITVSLSNRYP